MINRIISLKNIGRFENYSHRGTVYDTLPKNVIFYAENGSGKTTLALLFKSLKSDDNLLKKKQSFGITEDQKAKLIVNGSVIEYSLGHWTAKVSELEIFDIHFIEDNLFTGSIADTNNKSNLFDYIIGDAGALLTDKAREFQSQWDILFKRQIALQNPANRENLKKKDWEKINKELHEVQKEMKRVKPLLSQAVKELGEFTKHVFDTHIEEINKQLKYFTSYIKVKKFSNKRKRQNHQLSYYLKLNETDITFDLTSKISSVKYSLSEGDKNAVALAFFLAKVYMSTNLSDKIVIFDDPLSSFDANRRNATIAQLQKLSSKVKQLIVLTHDIYFARDIKKRLGSDALSLKVVRKSNNSDIVHHDISKETLGGIFKDISTLIEYSINGSDIDEKKREVIRCIRPTLEGIIRIKFFDVIRKDEWLGDFISKSRQANIGEPFYSLKKHLDSLIELNDYSKHYHHSNPEDSNDDIINEMELKEYTKLALKLVKEI